MPLFYLFCTPVYLPIGASAPFETNANRNLTMQSMLAYDVCAWEES